MAMTKATWFLTAPEISTPRRRGDPLGLRNITDEVADLLAPGLTNRTLDARWLTLLSWSLVQSDRAWRKAGGDALRTAEERRQRYAWLQPLELLWVVRSMQLGGAAYRAIQWPGYRSLKRWDKAESHFAMTASQRKNHRQLGAYGAYRVLFRQAGFTVNDDGWTPAEPVRILARLVEQTLEQERGSAQWKNKPQSDNPAQWWLTTGWRRWRTAHPGSKLLLSALVPQKLTAQEIKVLAPSLFPADSGRWRTARAIGANEGASNYVALCAKLAATLPRSGSDVRLAALGVLAALNDAGLGVLRAVALCVTEGTHSIPGLSRETRVLDAVGKFYRCADAWRRRSANMARFEHQAQADKLAGIAAKGTQPFLRRFMDHHEQCGTGARWFVRDDDVVVLMGAEAGTSSGNFGYRLHALAHLAVQCGVISALPAALAGQAANDDAELE
jgi:hypothetical protein